MCALTPGSIHPVQDDVLVATPALWEDRVPKAPRMLVHAAHDVCSKPLHLQDPRAEAAQERLSTVEHVALGALDVNFDDIDDGHSHLGEQLIEGGDSDGFARVMAARVRNGAWAL